MSRRASDADQLAARRGGLRREGGGEPRLRRGPEPKSGLPRGDGPPQVHGREGRAPLSEARAADADRPPALLEQRPGLQGHRLHELPRLRQRYRPRPGRGDARGRTPRTGPPRGRAGEGPGHHHRRVRREPLERTRADASGRRRRERLILRVPRGVRGRRPPPRRRRGRDRGGVPDKGGAVHRSGRHDERRRARRGGGARHARADAAGAEGGSGRVPKGAHQHHRRHEHRGGGPGHPQRGPDRVFRRRGHHPDDPADGADGAREGRARRRPRRRGPRGGEVQERTGPVRPHGQVAARPGALLQPVQRLPEDAPGGTPPEVRPQGARADPGEAQARRRAKAPRPAPRGPGGVLGLGKE